MLAGGSGVWGLGSEVYGGEAVGWSFLLACWGFVGGWVGGL